MRFPVGSWAEAGTVLTVSELNQQVRSCIESTIGEVWVAGEISNFRVPASGHFYFRLKDERSQIAAVMFRSANHSLPFRPEDGMAVIVHGRVGVYDVRGDLQIYVDALEPQGVGTALLALRQLKERLEAEGLFDPRRKRPLPVWPRSVGVVTALTGAAVHDMLTTLRSRMPGIPVVIRPVRVQGAEAGSDIVSALGDLNQLPMVDVIVVGRGGGSLEDLWAFNEERGVRAIAASNIPVVSAVGHEIDVTLADLAADRRAATPTAAAALVVPDRREVADRLSGAQARLLRVLEARLRDARIRADALARRLRDPRHAIRAQRLRIDELGERARRATEAALRLARERVRGGGEQLHALSPLAVLQRGYSITRRFPDATVVRAAADLGVGDRVEITLAQGWARARVEENSG